MPRGGPGKSRPPRTDEHKQALSNAAHRRWAQPGYREMMQEIHRNRSPRTKRWVRSLEANLRQGETRRRKFADGSLNVPRGAGRGNGEWFLHRGSQVWLRSSYELVFASYCALIHVDWDYESVRVPHGSSTRISDFEIDGELFEVYGWQNKSSKVEAFETQGWVVHLVGPEEIDLMGMFL